MNASNDERSETISSTEHLESIALDALAAPSAALSRTNQEQGERDLQVALGKHPNIATLLGADAIEIGQPGKVVNHVCGQRIDDYCDSQRLKIPARLKLFAQVCRAVHFAHQHAVIHGDLKPSNIGITADGVPKVMGFGIARLLHPKAAGEDGGAEIDVALRMPTQASELMASPEYTSPEHLNGEPITTASDIYALGVVLYQLLTGRSPYRLTSGTRSDVCQAVFQQAPEKPSSAVTRRRDEPAKSSAGMQPTLVETPLPEQSAKAEPRSDSSPLISTVQAIASARGCSPKRLKRILTGDLDAIVLRALRKEPERRYASAEHFADDLNRYLEGMPVLAHGDWTVYRTGKFLQRHAVLATIALLAVALCFTAIAGTTKGFIIALRQRDRTENSLTEARETIDRLFNRVSTERLLNQPGFYPLRAALFEDTRRFYRDYLNLHSADRTLQPELIEARSRVAKIASLIGTTAESVLEYRQAAALWEQLVLEQPTNRHYQEKLAATLGDLGAVLMPIRDQLDEAGRILRRAWELIEALIAAEPQSVSMRQKLGWILLNLAQIRSQQDHPDKALELLEHSQKIELQLATESPDSLEPRIVLAIAYATAGRILAPQANELHRAIASYQQASEIYQTIVQEHPELADQSYQFARNLNELSELQQRAGQLDLAFQNLNQSLSIFYRLDQWYPESLIYRKGLGSIYTMMAELQRKRAETADSLALAQKARAVFERLVSDHPLNLELRIDLADSYNTLGRQFESTGESDGALRAFQRAIDLYESLPELDSQTAYKLACTISRCIPLFGTKNRSTDSGRAALEPSQGDRLRRRLYGDRAITALRRAVRTGRFAPETLETEKDLDPLHDRSDFRDLVKDLEKKPVAAGS
jgi:eukaryotic-like serine/threonine-protein kinase